VTDGIAVHRFFFYIGEGGQLYRDVMERGKPGQLERTNLPVKSPAMNMCIEIVRLGEYTEDRTDVRQC